MASSLDEVDLATQGHVAWATFQVAFETLEKNVSTFSKQPNAAGLRSEMQRFQLWAINLGLLRQDHSSLDYRLRDNEVVKSFTTELLTSLIEALQEITNIANPDNEASPSIIAQTPKPDALSIEIDQTSSVSNDRESHNSSIIDGTLEDGNLSMGNEWIENESLFTLHFEDMTEAIDQMYNLASQIRNPKARRIRTDIDLFNEVDDDIKSEYIKLRTTAESRGIEQMLLQSRKSLLESQAKNIEFILTDEHRCLILRLQKANHARRQQFEYWKRSKKRSIRAASKAIGTIPTSKDSDRRLEKVLKHDTGSLVQPSEITRSLMSSVPALSKKFVLSDKKSTYLGASRGLTVHGPSGGKVDWPKPPVTDPSGGDFECPFCFYFCAPRYWEDVAWRSHLKHDLRPYICTYNECTDPNVLYDSWEEWVHHEQWAHQQRIWRCLEHPQQKFVQLSAYEDHVKTSHTTSMHQLLSSQLLKSQESISQVCDRPCPFCQREFEQPIELQRHIACHLESIALLSLPNIEEIDERSEAGKVNSNSANRNCADSKAGDFDRTEALVFPENYHSTGPPVVTNIDTGLFERQLKVESTSFNSTPEVDTQARQAYSNGIVGEWMLGLPFELDDIKGDAAALHTKNDGALIALAETAEDIAGAFVKCSHQLKGQPADAELTTLTAECFSISSALRELDKSIGGDPDLRRYEEISGHLTTVKDSLKYTFREVRRILGGLSESTVIFSSMRVISLYMKVWKNLSDHFLVESGNTLRRRLDTYRAVLQGLSNTMLDRFSRPHYFEESITEIERVLAQQQDGFAEARDGIDLKANHWLPNVFNKTLPSTPLEDTNQLSVSLGENQLNAMARLIENGYVNLIELPFESDDLIVELFQHPTTYRSMVYLHTKCPGYSSKICLIDLESLNVSRNGSFLHFYERDQSGRAPKPEVWARLRLPHYESLVLVFCSILALKTEDLVSPPLEVFDSEIEGERLLFAGLINDDH